MASPIHHIRRTAEAILDILYGLAELGAAAREEARRLGRPAKTSQQIRIDVEVRNFLRSLTSAERAELYAVVARECDDDEIEGWTVGKGWEA